MLRHRILSLLPSAVVRQLRRRKKDVRRLRYRLRERGSSVSLSQDDVAAALREAGLSEGDGVFVHSAMSTFGKIDGGPPTVIAALEEVLGPDALIAMPAFPLVGGGEEYLSTDPVFDVRNTPSTMGAITEHFRKLPDVARSLHPTHSVAARGPGAAELVADHADAATPFGEGTPFARMVDRGLHQVWFGTGIMIFTLYHTFESLYPGGFPIDVFHERRFAARCIDEHGRERTVSTLVHDPGVSARKTSSREEMRRQLTANGVLRVAELRRGEILAARMPELMRELDAMLAQGLTIYDIELDRVESA
ncbi:MAG: AAC(3) family N-acetyltransferase [Actinomycetota bacterium]|nr:AAC(3) family N-acetyltransferase [Actinomycetota bacterium]